MYNIAMYMQAPSTQEIAGDVAKDIMLAHCWISQAVPSHVPSKLLMVITWERSLETFCH